MLCAMASRAPAGGIPARYAEVVESVAESLFSATGTSWAQAQTEPVVDHRSDHDHGYADAGMVPASKTVADVWRARAEERLCTYPLHPKVQRFFDDFVGKYGHSSILELVGSPAVGTEGVSWLTNWLLFDSPLCAGQEFSTRAVQHRDWLMAHECSGDPELAALHTGWMGVFEAEVGWWKEHFADPANRQALGIGDKEPFRPALDRARWALPGTIALGCTQTSGIRERARVLKLGRIFAEGSSATDLWDEIAATYREAMPGLAGMGLKEAVYSPDQQALPGHLAAMFSDLDEGPDVEVHTTYTEGLLGVNPTPRTSERAYLDPLANTLYRVDLQFRGSLACARDWHRHRTLYPMLLQVVRRAGALQIDYHYGPRSEIGIARTPDLLRRSTEIFDRALAAGNRVRAGMALPFGTRVGIQGQAGLRDAVYLLELRYGAHGANFEYKEQAGKALAYLRAEMGASYLPSDVVHYRCAAEVLGMGLP